MGSSEGTLSRVLIPGPVVTRRKVRNGGARCTNGVVVSRQFVEAQMVGQESRVTQPGAWGSEGWAA